MVRDRLAEPDAATAFVLDGLPNQAVRGAMLDAVLSDLAAPIDRVVDLVLTDDEVVRRLSGRRVCRDCGRIWHLEFTPPARPGVRHLLRRALSAVRRQRRARQRW